MLQCLFLLVYLKIAGCALLQFAGNARQIMDEAAGPDQPVRGTVAVSLMRPDADYTVMENTAYRRV